MVTVTAPVVAPVGTASTSCVAELLVNTLVVVPLKLTRMAPARLVPARVTLVPTAPLVGEMLVSTGKGTVKLLVLVAVPAVAVTLIGPV